MHRHEAERSRNFISGGYSAYVTGLDSVSPTELAALRDALNTSLILATERQVAETIALIFGAWPYAGQRVDPTAMDVHVRSLAEDLAEFPADILRDVVRDLRRTQKFVPAISELYEAATLKVKLRNYLLRDVEKCIGRPGAGHSYVAENYRPTRIESF